MDNMMMGNPLGEVHWKTVHPYGKWLMVKADPRVKKTAGGIHLTDELVAVERVMEGTGRILAQGSEVRQEEDINVGDRVAYRGFLKDVSRGYIAREDDCDIFLIRVEDLIAVIGEGVTMGAFSSAA